MMHKLDVCHDGIRVIKKFCVEADGWVCVRFSRNSKITHPDVTKFIISIDDDVMKKIGMRIITTVLAKTLKAWCRSKGIQNPDGLDYWSNAIFNPDELAEIRNAWAEKG